MTLVKAHREFLIKLITDYLNSLERKSISFSDNGCVIEDATHVTKVYIGEDKQVHVITYNSDWDNWENKFDDCINDDDEFDDLFLTELLYKIENSGANSFKWRVRYDGEDTYKSVETYDSEDKAYAAMRMNSFIQIENLTCAHEELDTEFRKDSIIITKKDNSTIRYELIKFIA